MNDILADERRQHSIPLLYRMGGWSLAGEEKVLPWLAAGIAHHHRCNDFVIVGWAGQVLAVEGAKSHREAIRRQTGYVSILRSVSQIGDDVYAVGMKRQIYRRECAQAWVEMDDGVADYGDNSFIGFNGLDGPSKENLYAVGLNGEIWFRHDGFWRKIDSPTNVHLHSVFCSSDGKIYIGGRSGLFLEGMFDAWIVRDLQTDQTVWSIRMFQNILYVLLDRGIFCVEREQLKQIDNKLVESEDFHTLASDDASLWVFGRKKIVRYDGVFWTELDCEIPEVMEDSDARVFFTDEVATLGSDYLDEQ